MLHNPFFDIILLRGVFILKGILTLEYITIYFGFSLMVLGILKIFNLVDLTSAYFFGLAISGLCFTLIDYAALNNKKK